MVLQEELRDAQLKAKLSDDEFKELACLSRRGLQRFWAERPEDGPSLNEAVRGLRVLKLRFRLTRSSNNDLRHAPVDTLVGYEHVDWAAHEAERIKTFIVVSRSAHSYEPEDLDRYINAAPGYYATKIEAYGEDPRFRHVFTVMSALGISLQLRDCAYLSDSIPE